MASGGYVAFPKSIYDALLAAPLTSAQLRVCLVIVRYTIGHRNQVDGARTSVRFIADQAKLNELTVRRALDALTAAGVVHCVAPSIGSRAAVLALEGDPQRWGWLAPGRPKRDGHKRTAGGFVVRAKEHAQTEPGESIVRAKEHAACVPKSTDKPALCVPRSTDIEERSETRSLKAGGSSANAPPPASEEPACFDLPGYGRVYEHDTWALEQPDSRALYLKTFGAPSRKGDRT